MRADISVGRPWHIARLGGDTRFNSSNLGVLKHSQVRKRYLFEYLEMLGGANLKLVTDAGLLRVIRGTYLGSQAQVAVAAYHMYREAASAVTP